MPKHPMAGTSTTGGPVSVLLTTGGFSLICEKCGLDARKLVDGKCSGCAT
jgi:hypothetical protein